MKFESLHHVREHAKELKMEVVIYKNKVIDVTDFKFLHPGGENSFTKFLGQEITTEFDKVVSHKTKSAIRDINTYCIGEVMVEKDGHVKKDVVDQSEKLDLKKGLLWQIFVNGMSRKDYMEFIHDPKHMINPPSAILFNWPIFEMFTKTPFWLIPTIYFPFMFYYFYLASLTLAFSQLVTYFLAGVLLWTFTEYCLHRFVFHMDDNIPDNRVSVLLHFLLHGIHHAFPMDGLRLVFPPVLGLNCLYLIKGYIMPIFGEYENIVAAGFILGYVFYDVTHYYIHHNRPSLKYFRSLKDYHILHHYKNPQLGYGVSNKLWDYVFFTVLYEDSLKSEFTK